MNGGLSDKEATSSPAPARRRQPRRPWERWLSLPICACCLAATLLFMQRTAQLELENQELQALLLEAQIRAQNGAMLHRQRFHGRGGDDPSEDPSEGLLGSSADGHDDGLQQLLVAPDLLGRVKSCLLSAPEEDAAPPVTCKQPSDPSSDTQQTWCPGGEGGGGGDVGEVGEWTRTEVASRVFVGAALVGALVAAALVLHNLDALPRWMTRLGLRALRARPDSEAPLSKLLAYRLDRWFSTNPYSKTLALLYVTLGMVAVGGLGIFTLSSINLDDALWEAVVGVGIDWTFPSEANPEDHNSSLRVVAVRFMGLLVSLGGMLVTALMLGIVSDAIGDQMDQMRKGKSEVQETDHTLILGWSDKLFGLISELANANESVGGSAIVILSERDKEEMQDDIENQSIDLRGSRIICRSGNPLLSADLDKVSVKTARSIVILAQVRGDEMDPDVADAFTLRIVMSIMSIHQNLAASDETSGGLKGHIVAEVCDLDNEPLLKMVSGSHPMETVVAHDIIGRLMIQSRRQPGLAAVWEDLLGFDGNEFYSQHWPELTGRTFGDVLRSFPDAVPVGILQPETVNVIINPSDDYCLEDGDQVLVLAEDDDTYRPGVVHPINRIQSLPDYKESPIQERILFLGWRRDLDDMIEVLDEFVVEGSELWLYSNVPIEDREGLLRKGGLDVHEDLKHLKLVFDLPELLGEVTDRRSLAKLRPERFSSILILGDNQGSSYMADSDSRALASLLLIREIQSDHVQSELCLRERHLMENAVHQWGTASLSKPWFHRLKSNFAVENCLIISEILDSRTRHLISELNISEYVMSNEIISMALAMVSESAPINKVLRELFTDVGNELYVHSAARYFHDGEQPISFFELMARARERQEIIIGYKTYSMARPALNPPGKSERVLSLSNVEMVVGVAEDDWALERALSQMSGRASTPSTVYRRQQRLAKSATPSSAGQSGRSSRRVSRSPEPWQGSRPAPMTKSEDRFNPAKSHLFEDEASKSSSRSPNPGADIPILKLPAPNNLSQAGPRRLSTP